MLLTFDAGKPEPELRLKNKHTQSWQKIFCLKDNLMEQKDPGVFQVKIKKKRENQEKSK